MENIDRRRVNLWLLLLLVMEIFWVPPAIAQDAPVQAAGAKVERRG